MACGRRTLVDAPCCVAVSYCLRLPLSREASPLIILSNRPTDAVLTCAADMASPRYFFMSSLSLSAFLSMPAPAPLLEAPAACDASRRFLSCCVFCFVCFTLRTADRASKGSTFGSSPGLASMTQSCRRRTRLSGSLVSRCVRDRCLAWRACILSLGSLARPKPYRGAQTCFSCDAGVPA